MRYYLSVPILLIISMCQPFGAYAADENIPKMSVKQVLDQYVIAVGGEEAISKLQTRMMRGILTHDLSSRKPPIFEEISIEAYAKLPGKRLLIESKEAEITKSGYDGAMFWEKTPSETNTSESESSLKLAWIQNPQNARKFEEYFPNLSYEEVIDLRGQLCHKLVPETLDPLYYSLYFSVESGLLVSLGWYWELHDWKEVDGVLVPHKVVADRKGGSTTYLFDKIVHNQDFDDSIFSAPK